MRLTHAMLSGVVSLLAVGCASRGGTAANVRVPSPAWSGNLQPTQQRSGGLVVTGQNRAFGMVSIGPAGGALERMRVHLTVAVPTNAFTSLKWAVLPDRCGTGELPLIGFDQFPLIDISTNGRGEVTADLPLVLSATGTYHVNVYNGGQQLDNVLTCANLKYTEGR